MTLNALLFAYVLLCAALAAYLHFRLRRTWAVWALLVVIVLGFAAAALLKAGALQ